jgi:hypothetical protein
MKDFTEDVSTSGHGFGSIPFDLKYYFILPLFKNKPLDALPNVKI